jgi:chromosome segregation protein
MRIKRLEIQGFKSFADRTVLHFGDGITGVVGPNGCGKSNIVDALRWAMGEQSAKHLRGDGMSDVIFAGSESRGPMGMAEVTITFKNDDGSLMPPELRAHAEVSVTRRLFRDGTSEYLMNRQPARLRDVVELFLGTGIGTKSYSIIEQGRIGLIVTSKPEDRRALIEDAAGITKYKARRKQAERRLEAAEQNLVRVSDVLAELKRRMGSLERQARKAERYKELKVELRTLDLRAAAQRGQELVGLAELEAAREAAARQALALIEEESLAAEAALGRTADAKDTLAADVAAQRARLAEVEQGLAVGTKNVEHLVRQQAGLLERREDAERERELLKVQLEQARAEREELTALAAQLELAREGEGDLLRAQEVELDTALLEIKARESDADRVKHAVFEVASRAGEQKNHVTNLLRRDADLEARLGRKRTEAEQVEQAAASHRAEAHEASGRLVAERAQRQAVNEALAEVESRLDRLQAEFMEVEAQALSLRGTLVDKRARRASLEEIQKNYEGCQEGVRAVMRQAQEDGELAKRLHGLVADVLVAPSELEVAIEAALGDKLQYVIVDDQDTGVASIGRLKQTADGRSTFIPMDLREDHTAWAPRKAARRSSGDVPSELRAMVAEAVARDDHAAEPARAEQRATLEAPGVLSVPSLIGDASMIAAGMSSLEPTAASASGVPPLAVRSLSDRPPPAEVLELAREAADELTGYTAVELHPATPPLAQPAAVETISGQPASAEAVAYADQLRAELRGDVALPVPEAADEEERWPDLSLPGVRGRMTDLVRTKDGFAHVARVLLGDVVLVDDLSVARELWRNNGHRKTLVTLAGEVLDPVGVLAGGSTSGVSAGLLAKKREIEELITELAELEAKSLAVNGRRAELEDVIAALETEARELAKRGHAGDLGIVKLEQDVRRLEASAAQSELRRQSVDAECAAIEAERAEVARERDRAEQAIGDLGARRGELEARVAEVLAELSAARARAEALNAKVTELKIDIAAQREKRESTRRGLTRAETRIVELESRLTRLADNLEASASEVEAIGREIAEAAAEKDLLAADALRRRDALSVLEADLAAISERLRAEDEALRATRRRVDEQRMEANDAQLRHREHALSREALAAQLEDRYQLALDQVIAEAQVAEALTPDDLERIVDLRKKLDGMGEINLVAIEEYEENKRRHDFLSGQKEDLDRAIDALKAAIKKINRTSQDRFIETFNLVNEKFQQVFPRLFHGGKASLELTPAADPLDAGVEMMAQPPGKKLQSVTLLSGGEKALTAVALIFSIFLIKPTPFCLLDEVDAPLDDANVGRYNDLIRDMSSISQFIVITHNKRTMEIPDQLYGVTMEEPGISKLVSVDIKATEQHLRRVS